MVMGSPVCTVSRNSSPSRSTVMIRFSFQMSSMMRPAAAMESTCLENSIAFGPTPISFTPMIVAPAKLDPIVWGVQRMQLEMSFRKSSALSESVQGAESLTPANMLSK
jgi:hypothetical protein